MSPPPCLYDTVIQSYVQLKSGFYGVGRPNPLSELRGVKVFAMLSLSGFFGCYFALGANIVPPIAYKSHSTPFPIRPHVLTPHSWLCDKNCRRSSAPKKKWNLEMADNTNVALPYMASTINYAPVCKEACKLTNFSMLSRHVTKERTTLKTQNVN